MTADGIPNFMVNSDIPVPQTMQTPLFLLLPPVVILVMSAINGATIHWHVTQLRGTRLGLMASICQSTTRIQVMTLL